MFEDKKIEALKAPQPINVIINGDFLTLVKGDIAICKLNCDDHTAMHTSITLLNGLLRADLVKGEIEQIRDLILEVVGS